MNERIFLGTICALGVCAFGAIAGITLLSLHEIKAPEILGNVAALAIGAIGGVLSQPRSNPPAN